MAYLSFTSPSSPPAQRASRFNPPSSLSSFSCLHFEVGVLFPSIQYSAFMHIPWHFSPCLKSLYPSYFQSPLPDSWSPIAQWAVELPQDSWPPAQADVEQSIVPLVSLPMGGRDISKPGDKDLGEEGPLHPCTLIKTLTDSQGGGFITF